MAVSAPELRRVTKDDVPALATVLARAFLDDPVASWAFRVDKLRLKALERFQGTRMYQLLGEQEVWTDSERRCAAHSETPGHDCRRPYRGRQIPRARPIHPTFHRVAGP